MLHAHPLPPKQMHHYFCAARPSIRHRSRQFSGRGTSTHTRSLTQHLPTSKHDAATQSSCLVSAMLHAPTLPPKQMRHHFCTAHPSIQHRSLGNSAVATQAPTLLSVTQHLPASDRDAAVQSSCLVAPMPHAPNLPPKQMRHHFCAARPSIQHRSRGNSAVAAQAPRCSL